MSVSTLPKHLSNGKRLLFVKETQANDDISLMRLPSSFQPISKADLGEMIKHSRFETPLPDAILVNLDSISIVQFAPMIKQLRANEQLRNIPVIGLKVNFSFNERIALLRAGFNDCFCRPIDWKTIQRRVRFLNAYADVVDAPAGLPDEPYKMPLGKRIFDVTVAVVVLTMFSPILLLVALCIVLESRGGVFYNQERVGTGYQIFQFKKFRSMRSNADSDLSRLAASNDYATDTNTDQTPTFFKMKDDPRVTRVGKIIRKLSIDELPQLINVLRGEMSIVGNRPLPLYEAEQLTCDDLAKRFMAPAGLTGLWQTDKRGKHNLNGDERVQLDMNYADEYSFWMDFKILLRTLPAMIQRGE